MDFNVFQATHQWSDYADYASENPMIRHGQWLMNELGNVQRDIYLKITNTDADCFFEDSRIDKFWYAVHDIWHGFPHVLKFEG